MTSTCGSPDFEAVNATGSVVFPSFSSLESHDNHTWTFSTAVAQVQDFAANTSITEQTYWLKTDPVVETELNDLPYWGCLILLEGFRKLPISTGTDYSTTCNGIFDKECYNAIMSTASYKAFQLDYDVSSIAQSCQIIASTPPPPQCKGIAWTSNLTAVPFGDITANTNNAESSCNVFNGSATHATFLTRTSDPSAIKNFSTYDKWMKQATPLIPTAWNRNVTVESPRWAESRLLCLTADKITAGSRIPTSDGSPHLHMTKHTMLFLAGVWALLAGIGLP